MASEAVKQFYRMLASFTKSNSCKWFIV